MRPLAFALGVALVLLAAGPASAGTIVINNGLAPPNPDNVIDAGDNYRDDYVYVHNVGCDATVEDPCPMPWGDPTSVEVVGGVVGQLRVYETSTVTMDGYRVRGDFTAYDSSTVTISNGFFEDSPVSAFDSSSITVSGGFLSVGLLAYDSSTVTLSGGEAGGLVVYGSSRATMSGGLTTGGVSATGSSTVTLSGGSVGRNLSASGESSVAMSGGNVGGGVWSSGFSTVTISAGDVWGDLAPHECSTITMSGGYVDDFLSASDGCSSIMIVGTDFTVDGVPVGFGPIEAMSGRLAGTLESGEPIDNHFCHMGGVCSDMVPAFGLITLVPEPDAALLFPVAVLSLAALRSRRGTTAQDRAGATIASGPGGT